MDMYVNFWAVIVAVVASIVVGSLWYGPFFGKLFMRINGMNEWSPEKQETMRKNMVWAYLGQIIASFVMFYVFARINGGLGHLTLGGGLMTGFWIWIGFVVPLAFGGALWTGKWTMFWLETSNMLVTLLAAGAIIGGWR